VRPPLTTGRARNGDRGAAPSVSARSVSLIAALLAVAAALPATALAAGAPGFQVTVTRHYGARGDASGFSAVLALSRTDAWAFGGTNPGGGGAPVALRWNGLLWRPWRLPAGLTDFISDASAVSARDIWAVSYAGGYALHWNGTRWTVAKRWRRHATLTGVTALGPADVWAFGTSNDGMRGMGTWHFDGHGWARVSGPAGDIYRACALSPANIWAVAATRLGGGFVEHFDGRSWRAEGAGAAALAGLNLDAVLALPGGGVWVAGNLRLPRGDGPLVLAHFNGRTWVRLRTGWQADTERLAPDGAGGLWITADDAGLGGGSLIGHLSSWGQLTWTPVREGLGSGLSDVAAVPGPGLEPVWLSGGYLTAAGGDAAIWGRGLGPRAAEVTSRPDPLREAARDNEARRTA
jgi:hypothetical protein